MPKRLGWSPCSPLTKRRSPRRLGPVIEIETSASIARPADEVFDVLADMARNPEWQQGMQSCEWTSTPPVAVGSTYDQVARFLGKEIRSSFEVVEFEPGRRIGIETTSGPMPIHVTRSVEPIGDTQCRVSATVRGDSSGVFRIAEPLMRPLVARSVRQDYDRLKELLETESSTS